MKTHKDLEAWKQAMELARTTYAATATFPKRETYGLAAQMRAAAVSIPSNIAEGAARNSNREFVRFLRVALGSLAELETQILLAESFKYLDGQVLLKQQASVGNLVGGLVRHLMRRI